MVPLPGPGVVDQTSYAYKNLFGYEADPSTSGITLLTEQATTSGTTKDFTIPSGAKRVTMMLVGVSLSTTAALGLKLGDADGIEDTGYVSSSGLIAASPAVVTSTTQFALTGTTGAATTVHSGTIILTLEDSSDFTWTITGSLQSADGVYAVAGHKALSAELTTVRLMGGTFDAGAVNVSWE